MDQPEGQPVDASEAGEEGETPGEFVSVGARAPTPPPPPPRPFNFGDAGDSDGFASSWASAKTTGEAETQCPPLIKLSQEVQTDPGVDQAVQADPPPPPTFSPVAVSSLPGFAEFVEKVVPLVMEALDETLTCHAFAHYDASWNDERGDISLVAEMPFRGNSSSGAGGSSLSSSMDSSDKKPNGSIATSDLETPQSCTAIAWNCTGALLAITYGGSNHKGWCTHRGLVRVWSVFRGSSSSSGEQQRSRGPLSLETGSCAMAVSFHPSRPSILAVGSFTGQLQLIDADREDALVVSTDINSEQAHREPVTAIAWVPSQSAVLSSTGTLNCELASASSDGRVIVWGLNAPSKGMASLTALRSLVVGGSASSRMSAEGGSAVPGITCIAWLASVGDSSQFLSGTEGGRLYKCSAEPQSAPKHTSPSPAAEDEKQDKQASQAASGSGNAVVLFNYEPHAGPVLSVSQSPMHRNVFLTTGADGAVRLYNALQARALLTLVPSDSGPLCAEWSPSRPCVFAAGCADGRVYFFDLSLDNGHARPAAVLRASSQDRALSAVAFNKASREYLATADSDGSVRVWELSSYLSEPAVLDGNALERYGEVSRSKRSRVPQAAHVSPSSSPNQRPAKSRSPTEK